MNKKTVIQLHGFTAVFFLPLAIIYAITGVMYILGYSGHAESQTVQLPADFQWPTSNAEARSAVSITLEDLGMDRISPLTAQRTKGSELYVWTGLRQRVDLKRTENGTTELSVSKNSLFRRFIEIHKNHAGTVFTVLGIGFGVAMLFLLLSGTFVMFTSKAYQKNATRFLIGGIVLCFVTFLLSL